MNASDIFTAKIFDQGDKLVIVCLAFGRIMAQVRGGMPTLQKLKDEWCQGKIKSDGRGIDTAVTLRKIAIENELAGV